MEQPLLKVEDLKVYFPIKGGVLGRTNNYVKAVDGISFEVFAGETLSIVGESGCGKSTTGRAILRLEEPTAGKIIFADKNILHLSRRKLRETRRHIQMIFQDPYASLNPRQTVKDILTEALKIQKIVPKEKIDTRVGELLEKVGIASYQQDRYPHEFSGGQRQRVGIARALAVEPKLIICDEAVSALDVSIKAQILNLLKKLQYDLRLTYVFISHDLGVVRHISDRIVVMYLGKIVEQGDKHSIFANPRHPYTQALLSAIPVPDPEQKKERIVLKGDVPSPIDPPAGCRFHTRCPFATDLCRQQEPQLRSVPEMKSGHLAACHYIEKLSRSHA